MPASNRYTRKATAENKIEYVRFSVAQHADRLTVQDVRDEPFGVLGSTLTLILKRVLRLGNTVIDVIAAHKDLDNASNSWKTLNTSAKFQAEINLYGHESMVDEIGRLLTEAAVHLQPPAYDFRQLDYINPQYLVLPGLADIEERIPQLSLDSAQIVADQIVQLEPPDLEQFMNRLSVPTYLRQKDSHSGIRTELKR